MKRKTRAHFDMKGSEIDQQLEVLFQEDKQPPTVSCIQSYVQKNALEHHAGVVDHQYCNLLLTTANIHRIQYVRK